jgi:hypothetical protein
MIMGAWCRVAIAIHLNRTSARPQQVLVVAKRLLCNHKRSPGWSMTATATSNGKRVLQIFYSS